MTPSLGSINLPGWAHKAQGNTLLTFTGLLIKDITDHTDEQSDRRDALGKACRKGRGAPCPLWVCYPPGMCSAIWKVSEPCSFGVLWRPQNAGVIDDIISHWCSTRPLVPCFSAEVEVGFGGGAESPNSMPWFFW